MIARLIYDLRPLDPYKNLAIEEALSRIPTDVPVVRLWVNKPSVILGRFAKLLREVNVSYCVDNGIYIARRHSGGGTVYQDEGNLNITLVAPRWLWPDIYACYEALAGVITLTLSYLGLSGEYVKPNEVLVNGLKVSGMAGSLTKYTLQCHSTLLVSSDVGTLRRSLKVLKREVTTLSKAVGEHLDVGEVSRVVVKATRAKLNYDLSLSSLKEDEVKLAQELYSTKHSLITWIYSR